MVTSAEKIMGCLRVRQDRCERLVELMRNRCRHFTGYETAIHARQLGRALAGLQFRLLSTVALIEQPGEQQGLPHQRGCDQEDLQPVLLPCRRRTEANFTSRW